MNSGYDAIVVGVGGMGSSACYHLAQRGMTVLGLEQFDIPHAKGSSHGQSRAIRMCYELHDGYVPLVRRAYELWRELEAATGQALLHVTGGLFLGHSDRPFFQRKLHAMRRHNLPHEVLDRQQIAERFGQFKVGDDYEALFDPNAGFVRPELAIATHAELAMRHGAVLHGHESVTSWTSDADGVSVTTDRSNYHADRLIFCGGAWSKKLIEVLGVELSVTRQALAWVWPKRPELFAMGTLPVWALNTDDGDTYYGFPMLSDSPGFKIALDKLGRQVNPDQFDREPTQQDRSEIRYCLENFVPDADPEGGGVLSMRLCMYTVTPDRNFIVDRHPAHENVIIAAGFSGHGFKFSPVIGEILADLATAGQTNLPINFLRLDRF